MLSSSARQAHQRGVHVVIRRRVAEHLNVVGEIETEVEQRSLDLQDDMGATGAERGEVAGHHDGIAQTLLGGEQQSEAARIDLAAPGGVLGVGPPLADALVLQADFEADPAFAELAEAELGDGAAQAGLHIVGVGGEHLVEPGNGLLGFAEADEGFADADPGGPVRRIDRGGLLGPGQGFGRAVQVEQGEGEVEAEFEVAGGEVDAAAVILQRFGRAFEGAVGVAAVVIGQRICGVGGDGRGEGNEVEGLRGGISVRHRRGPGGDGR